MSDAFVKAWDKAFESTQERKRYFGNLGRKNASGHPDGPYTFQVPGRPSYVFVTLRINNGAQTAVPARNDAGVPWRAGLAVEMHKEGTTYVIVRKSGRLDLTDAPPDDGSGIEPHTHRHETLLGLTDDDHLQYHTDARGDVRYYTKAQHIAVSAGAADAGKPIVLDAAGLLDATFIDPEDIQDIIGPFFVDSSSIDFSYTDGSNNATASVIDEYIQDIVGAMFSGNTETNIAATYDDTLGKIDLVVSTSTEDVQDIIGALLVDSSSINYTYTDGSNTLTTVVIDEYIQDLVGLMFSSNTETLITVTYQDSDGTIDLVVDDSGFVHIANTETITGAKTFNSALTIATGSSLIFTDSDVAHGMTVLAATDVWFQVVPISGTIGGATISAFTDDDQTALQFIATIGSTNPTDTTPAMLFASRKANGTGSQALAAAETAFQFRNASTTLISVLGDGKTKIGGGSSPNTTLHVQNQASRSEIKIQQFDGTNDTARLLLHSSSDGFIAAFEASKGSFRHTFADGFVPSGEYFSLYTASAIPLYFGTNDIVRQAILSDGRVFFGLTTGNANLIGMKAGTSTNDAAVGGVLYVSTTQVNSAASLTGDLAIYTVPASTLAVNGQSLWFEASGTIANGASVAEVSVWFGGVELFRSAPILTAAADSFWSVRGRIIRTGATSIKAHAVFMISDAEPTTPATKYATATPTLSAANNIKIVSHTDSTAADIVQEIFIVGWDDANT